MEEHGYYVEGLRSYAFSGTVEAQLAKEFIAQLRKEPLREIGGEVVTVVRDYGRSVELDLAQGTSAPITLPRKMSSSGLPIREQQRSALGQNQR